MADGEAPSGWRVAIRVPGRERDGKWNSLEMKDFHEYPKLYNEGREGQRDGEEIFKNQ